MNKNDKMLVQWQTSGNVYVGESLTPKSVSRLWGVWLRAYGMIVVVMFKY